MTEDEARLATDIAVAALAEIGVNARDLLWPDIDHESGEYGICGSWLLLKTPDVTRALALGAARASGPDTAAWCHRHEPEHGPRCTTAGAILAGLPCSMAVAS